MKRILSVSAFCAVMFALVLTGCKKDKTFTVTFDSQGGSAVAAINDVADGSKITQPADPTKNGFEFWGWYKEVASQNVWDFTTDVVTADVTLYAKWEIKYDFFGGYWGDYYENGSHNFDAEIYTPGLIDSEGYLTGIDGEYCYLDFNSASAVGGAPQAGNYTYVGEEPGAAGTFGVVYIVAKNGEPDFPTILGGTFTVLASSSIKLNLTCSDGSHSITCKNPVWSNQNNAPARAPKAAKKANFKR